MLFGDRISDPLGGGKGGEMAKADTPMVLFLKAEDQDPDRYAGSPDDEREDERNAKEHNMTVAE